MAQRLTAESVLRIMALLSDGDLPLRTRLCTQYVSRWIDTLRMQTDDVLRGKCTLSLRTESRIGVLRRPPAHCNRLRQVSPNPSTFSTYTTPHFQFHANVLFNRCYRRQLATLLLSMSKPDLGNRIMFQPPNPTMVKRSSVSTSTKLVAARSA